MNNSVYMNSRSESERTTPSRAHDHRNLSVGSLFCSQSRRFTFIFENSFIHMKNSGSWNCRSWLDSKIQKQEFNYGFHLLNFGFSY